MEIKINRFEKTIPYYKNWQFGVGNDHAYTVTRTDVFEFMKYVHQEIGFKYIRFHGIFDDDMHIYQRLSDFPLFSNMDKADEIVEINFKQVGVVLDNVLKAGFKPFIELSFMPSALASENITGFHYKNNITQPKSYAKWTSFIKKFINYLVERYTLEEVRTWYFEVWNEPDIQVIFFRGTKEEYFKLYEETVKAIKEVSQSLKVGGPSTSGCLWIEEFKDFCENNQVPYDFVSTHHYPGDGFGNNFGKERFMEIRQNILKMAEDKTSITDAMRSFFYHPEEYKLWPESILRLKDKKTREVVGNKPLYISEWNSIAVYGAPIHDEKISACFIVKTCLETGNICDGHMFWCLSDFFEEQFLIHKPFHGGFGILTNDGIPKPNFYAFKILNQLYPNRFITKRIGQVEYTCFVEENKMQVLLYAFSNDFTKNEINDVSLTINDIVKSACISCINDENTNPKRLWMEMGAKENLLPKEVEFIKNSSRLKAYRLDYEICEAQSTFKFNIATNDVVFIELEFEKNGE